MVTAVADESNLRVEAIEVLKRAGWSPRQINKVIASGRVYSPSAKPDTRGIQAQIGHIVGDLCKALKTLDWKVTIEDLKGKATTRAIAAPRGAAMSLAREILGEAASFPQIGAWFGRDHATVMHAVHIAKWREIADDRLHKAVKAVRASYRGAKA